MEKSLLETSELCPKFDDVIIGDRIKFKGRVFHSINYKRNGNLNSYTVSYLKDQQKYFGQIQYFIQHSLNYYAYIIRLRTKNDLSSVLPGSSGIFNEFIHSGLMEKFYKLVIKTPDHLYDLINCNAIQKRCMIIPNEKYDFITEISYEYEHD